MLKHDFPFDPTYGYTLEKLLQVGPPNTKPADFRQFWESTYADALKIPLNIEKKPLESKNENYDLFQVNYNSLDNFRIGAWVVVPKDQNFKRGVVVGHGYGGREAPEYDRPGPPCVAIYPCARGFHLSARSDYPSTGHFHVLKGIESRETYSHRGSVVDYWLAGSVLLELFPQLNGTFDYEGVSFGGGIGAMLLPWDKRIRRAGLGVPSFGNHPLRLTMQSVGSGEAVRLYHQRYPEVTEVLKYFDSATHATHTKIPVAVYAALFDPAVCPPGQFCVYNSLAGPRKLIVRECDHFEGPNSPQDWINCRNQFHEFFSS